MMRARLSSAAPSSTGSSNKPNNFVAKARKRRKRRHPNQGAGCVAIAARVLCGMVLLFALYDLYCAVDLGFNKHSLRKIEPLLQEQAKGVKEALKEEKDRLVHMLRRDHATDDDNHDAAGDAADHEGGIDADAEQPADTDDHAVSVPTKDENCDKEPLYEILEQAGVPKGQLSSDAKAALPCWSEVQRIYGSYPRIFGLDSCERFTNNVEPSVSFFGIAGVFNSGTNLLAEMLIQNCQIDARMEKYGSDQKGMRWQVPWGKHTPLKFREAHVTPTDADVPLENSLPMITIRDPYRWMRSMCKHIYGARWNHNITECPHVYIEEIHNPSPVRVKYKASFINHKSLPGMWNDWYTDYLGVDFPRVVVRFEDLLFYGKNVTQTLCKCGGGSPRRDHFVHVKSSAKLGTKAHGANKTNLLDALIQFGQDEDRIKGFSENDLIWSKKLLDPKLMEMFNYFYA